MNALQRSDGEKPEIKIRHIFCPGIRISSTFYRHNIITPRDSDFDRPLLFFFCFMISFLISFVSVKYAIHLSFTTYIGLC
jgi:hypothetical protein